MLTCDIVSVGDNSLSGGTKMTDEKKTPEIEEADFITLEFDDGVEVECEIMGVF